MGVGRSFTINHPIRHDAAFARARSADTLHPVDSKAKHGTEEQDSDGTAKIFPESKQKMHKENKQKYSLENL